MAAIPQLYSGLLQLAVAASQMPIGVIVGAVTERVCRRGNRSHARSRNVAIKIAIAHVSVSFLLGKDNMPTSWGSLGPFSSSNERTIDTEILAIFFLRLVLFASGTIVGAALQPVGLTGGIATGKSTVSSLFQQSAENKDSDDKSDEEVEFIIINVDGIAHDILLPKTMAKDESVYDRLIAEFGTEILTKEEEGRDKNATPPIIDRRKLGDLVFPDRQKRKKLNSITHPTIIKIMFKRILLEGLNLGSYFSNNPKSNNKERRRVVCVDIPLLFEGGLPMRMLFGTVIVVACNATLQLERLQKRNPDLTLEQCKQRIASQIPVETKARKAHVVIRNDDSLKELKDRVRQVKVDVAEVISGSQRGVELSWMVIGLGVLALTLS